MKWFKAIWYMLITSLVLWASGIVPAIVPQMVPTGFKRGNSTIFALAGSATAGTAGAGVCDDGAGNFVTTGCTPPSTAPLFSQTNSVTDAVQTTETSLTGTGSGSNILTANTFAVGTVVHFSVSGIYSTTGTPGTLRIRLKTTGGATGTVTLGDTGTITPISSVTNGVWRLTGDITCRTVGAGGTLILNTTFESDPSSVSTLTPANASITNTAASTVDTTSTQTIDVTAVWSAAGQTITSTNYVLTSFSGGGGGGSVNAGTAGQVGYYATNGTAISGAAGMTTHGLVLFEGTSAPASTAAGMAGQCLTSNGAALDPTFQACAGGGGGNPGLSFPSILLTLTLPVLTDFTAFTTPANTATTTDTGKGITITGANNTLASFFTTATTNTVATGGFTGVIGPEDFGQEGINCRESSTNASIQFTFQHNAGVSAPGIVILTLSKINANGTFSAAYKQSIWISQPGSLLTFLKLQNVGGNRVASISADGVNYTTFFSVGQADFATCNQFGFTAGGSTNWPPNFRLVHWLAAP
jgi:hypothetical protein